jgi:hypothetical protein
MNFYMCLRLNCNFETEDAEKMREHVKIHDTYNVLEKTKKLSGMILLDDIENGIGV